MRVKQRSINKLQNLYLPWISKDCVFMRPTCLFDSNGLSAAEIMVGWEGQGIYEECKLSSIPCSEPELLADYIQGKKLRDWHITEYKADIKAGLFFVEDMIGLGDLKTKEDVIKVIGIESIEEGKKVIKENIRFLYSLKNKKYGKLI